MHVEIRAAGDKTVLIPQSVRQRLRRRCWRSVICSLLILVLLLLVPLAALAAVIFGHAVRPQPTGNRSLLARTLLLYDSTVDHGYGETKQTGYRVRCVLHAPVRLTGPNTRLCFYPCKGAYVLVGANDQDC